MKKKLKKACKEIARDLIDTEGSDPEFLSITESIWDYSQQHEIDEDTKQEMATYIDALISSAIITIEFPEDVN